MDRLGVSQGQIDYMSVQIRILIQVGEFLKGFFTIERWGQKRYMSQFIKKLWTGCAKTWWMIWVGDKNKPITF